MNDNNQVQNNVKEEPTIVTNRDVPVLEPLNANTSSVDSNVVNANTSTTNQVQSPVVETLEETPSSTSSVASDMNANSGSNLNTGVSATNVNPVSASSSNVSSTNNNASSPNLASSSNGGASDGVDPATLKEQKMKEVEINYKPPGKFKIFLLIVFFVFLIGYVMFLPEINSLIENYRVNKEASVVEVITTGRLSCSLERSTESLDIIYDSVFNFEDSKLKTLSYTVTTRGDADIDEKTLDEENEKCQLLKQSTDKVDGVIISCNYSQGLQKTKQSFDFAVIDVKKMDAAYAEAGGMVVEFEYEESIDTIEKNLKASGYTCERKK